MRALILCVVLLCSGCAHVAQDNWTGKDKAEHFFSSAALAAAGSEISQHQHQGRGQNLRFGFLFSLSFGVGKEWYDSRSSGSGWSWKDLSWDVAGAASGIALWNLSQ
ncbi:YfiM family lipoprotein [Candidatus Pantoea floridensis]|uniref:Putative lipoprotein n=1 Tax=Candidatus Pantoea floridensis TaxID=1938870 RepID=A0A286BW84_9GAMM|nr:YfiM family lipoprotein [Pantoea floridensis]PIF20883.1 putative lipoprotein [Enterobacteriaceae bacterium JKS000233]SOD38399.1 putative lipoprotein [Pantoea floridensis]